MHCNSYPHTEIQYTYIHDIHSTQNKHITIHTYNIFTLTHTHSMTYTAQYIYSQQHTYTVQHIHTHTRHTHGTYSLRYNIFKHQLDGVILESARIRIILSLKHRDNIP